jgi:hypothetical protein
MTQVNPRDGDDSRRTDERDQTPGEPRPEAKDTDRADDRGQVSEAGSGALNEETTEGGADSVPDTPDTSAGDDLG